MGGGVWAQVLRRGEELGLETRRAHLDSFLQDVLLDEQQWGMAMFKLSRSGPGYPVGACSSLANLKTHRHKPVILRVCVCDPARNRVSISCVILPVPRTLFSSSPHIRLWRKRSLGMWFRDWTRLSWSVTCLDVGGTTWRSSCDDLNWGL